MNSLRKLLVVLIAAIAFFSFQQVTAQRAKDCGICYGSGKCQTCYGRGGETHYYGNNVSYRECGACRGTKRCSHCNGSGLDPYQDYSADIPTATASSAADGGDNPKSHLVQGRNHSYEAIKFYTDDEKNWLYEKGSAGDLPDGWQLMNNMVQFGEDTNYWYLRAKDPDSAARDEVIVVPKNSYGDILFTSGNGEWNTVAFLGHDYRFVSVNYNGYSYFKTFQGPTWRKMSMPYGGNGIASLVGICEETSEDDNYWYVKDGSTTISLAKTGSEVGKRSTFKPVDPTPVDEIESQNGDEDSAVDSKDSTSKISDGTSSKESASSVPSWAWVIILLLVGAVSTMGTYIFMQHRQGQNVKKKPTPKSDGVAGKDISSKSKNGD